MILAAAKWIALALGANVGIATNFSAVGDRWNPVPWAACLRRDLDDARDFVVAHRTLPCLSRVLVVSLRTGRAVVAIVGDRGPRRASIDLAPRVARAIGANGKELVAIVPIGGNEP